MGPVKKAPCIWYFNKNKAAEKDDLQNPHVSFQQGPEGAQSEREGATYANDLIKSGMWGKVV